MDWRTPNFGSLSNHFESSITHRFQDAFLIYGLGDQLPRRYNQGSILQSSSCSGLGRHRPRRHSILPITMGCCLFRETNTQFGFTGQRGCQVLGFLDGSDREQAFTLESRLRHSWKVFGQLRELANELRGKKNVDKDRKILKCLLRSSGSIDPSESEPVKGPLGFDSSSTAVNGKPSCVTQTSKGEDNLDMRANSLLIPKSFF